MAAKILFVYIKKFKDYPILYEYCTTLQAMGNQVYYLGISDSEEEYFDSSGVTVYHANRNVVKSKYLFSKHFVSIVEKLNPDLIHVFHFRWCILLPLNSFFSSTFVLDVRTVHIVNKSGEHSLLTPFKNRLTWFESLFFVNSIALTNEIRRILLPSFRSIPVIPLGANVSKLDPTKSSLKKKELRVLLGLPEQSKIFLYAGTINPIRRIDRLIESFKLLSHGANNVYLIIAGNDIDSPDTLTKTKELSVKLGIGDRVLFTDFLPYDKLIQYYHAADIGLSYVPQVPFFDKQPPTKLFEYIASGLIVISTATTVAGSVITDGINGFLLSDDISDFAAGMNKVLNLTSADQQKITLASKEILQKHSWEYIIKLHLCSYYQKLGLKVKC